MTTARDRARTELTAEILACARTQLAEVGPASLSLRAVARDLGMVSSAVYRYVASRDELLTLLLVACYDELGVAVEEADALLERSDCRGRWQAACQRIRTWALEHPHEYALLYGSPVPGYQAPATTVEPATRPTFVLTRIVVDAHVGPLSTSPTSTRVPVQRRGEPDNLGAARAFVQDDYRGRTGTEMLHPLDDEIILRTLMAWTNLFGAVSFELFGHLVGSMADPAVFYSDLVDRLADSLGLPA